MGDVLSFGAVNEVCLFEADQVDLLGLCFDREALVAMVPHVAAKPGVVKAWMDGDRLMARIRNTAQLQGQRKRAVGKHRRRRRARCLTVSRNS